MRPEKPTMPMPRDTLRECAAYHRRQLEQLGLVERKLEQMTERKAA